MDGGNFLARIDDDINTAIRIQRAKSIRLIIARDAAEGMRAPGRLQAQKQPLRASEPVRVLVPIRRPTTASC